MNKDINKDEGCNEILFANAKDANIAIGDVESIEHVLLSPNNKQPNIRIWIFDNACIECYARFFWLAKVLARMLFGHRIGVEKLRNIWMQERKKK